MCHWGGVLRSSKVQARLSGFLFLLSTGLNTELSIILSACVHYVSCHKDNGLSLWTCKQGPITTFIRVAMVMVMESLHSTRTLRHNGAEDLPPCSHRDIKSSAASHWDLRPFVGYYWNLRLSSNSHWGAKPSLCSHLGIKPSMVSGWSLRHSSVSQWDLKIFPIFS